MLPFAIPPAYTAHFDTIRQLAAEQGLPLYLVGGYVRDWPLPA